MSNSIPMTQQGKQRLEDELRKLKKVERPAVIEAISVAREHGDLSENAEYHAAREKQSFIEGRIMDIGSKLVEAHVIDPKSIKTDKIVFGATVTLQNTETEEMKTYSIVGTDESDAAKGLISIESPIARQLLNKREKDEVTVRVPAGETDYKVISIKYE